jgi:hypothetical protein
MLKTVGNPSTRYGDQTILNGNIVIGTAGNGIDFSADPHAAGMTSELLDDYEEGVWTPTLIASTTNFASVTYNAFTGAKYTKIGRLVHVSGIVRTATVDLTGAAGIVQIGGLPFVNGASTGGTTNGIAQSNINWAVGLAGDFPLGGYIAAGASVINLSYRAAINNRTFDLDPSDIGTTVNQIWFDATYHV